MPVAIGLLHHGESALRVGFGFRRATKLAVGHRQIVERLCKGWMSIPEDLLLDIESSLQPLLGLLVAVLLQIGGRKIVEIGRLVVVLGADVDGVLVEPLRLGISPAIVKNSESVVTLRLTLTSKLSRTSSI